MTQQSTMRWFDSKKGYGFIQNPDRSTNDIFFHTTAIQDLDSLARIREAGRRGVPIAVAYEIDKTKERLFAKWVRCI